MKKGTITTTLLLVAGVLLAANTLYADDDHEREEEGHGFLARWFSDSDPRTGTAQQHFYVEGCGGCHFPYQPGFLPARSWQKIMSGLEDHFGENAELSEEEAALVRNFLLDNAAGQVDRGFSNKVMASLGNDSAPMRITDTRYFRHEHDELPARMVEENPDVGSFSNCDVCHTQALQGSFNERQVRIPGYGRWDD